MKYLLEGCYRYVNVKGYFERKVRLSKNSFGG